MLTLPTGSKNSLSTYFLPRIKWLQDRSQILFGKVHDDCIYILIDTSHSMKSKLDLVKDKIIQFIQVRRNCQMHGFRGLCIMNASVAAFTCTGYERCTGRVCTQVKAPFCQLEESSVLLCKQTLPFCNTWIAKGVSVSTASGFLCPEICGVHTSPLFSRCFSDQHFNFQYLLTVLHALATELMCGRGVG